MRKCLVVWTLRSTASWCAVFLLSERDIHSMDNLFLFELLLYDIFLKQALLILHLLLSPFSRKDFLFSQVLLSQLDRLLSHDSGVLFIYLHLLLKIFKFLLPHPKVLLHFFVVCCHQHHVSSLDLIHLGLDQLLHFSPIRIVRPSLTAISKTLPLD